MRIREAKHFPFSLKLKTPFRNSNFTISRKDGFILILKDEFENVSFGECSPLPGFNKETLIEAEKELYFLVNNIDSLMNHNYRFVNSSVAFAVEQALLSLQFQRETIIKNNFASNKQLNTNAVVGLVEIDEALKIIAKKIEYGFDTFKLKVGRENPYDDFLLIQKVRDVFGYKIKLRLDANRKWNSDEAIEYLYNLQDFLIEYVEEPCDSICGLFKTCNKVNIPLAMDESLNSFETTLELLNNCDIKFFVLKPMMIGFNSTLKLIEEANKLNKYVIISSSFESAIGKSGLVFLASQANHNFAHGLGTSHFFEHDLVEDFYKSDNSFIEFDIHCYPPKFILV